MYGVADLGGGSFCAVHVVAICFVDDYAVGHLHNAAFDALKLVAGASDEH